MEEEEEDGGHQFRRINRIRTASPGRTRMMNSPFRPRPSLPRTISHFSSFLPRILSQSLSLTASSFTSKDSEKLEMFLCYRSNSISTYTLAHRVSEEEEKERRGGGGFSYWAVSQARRG